MKLLRKINPFRQIKKGVDKGVRKVQKTMILGILRHVLTTAGGAALGTGYISADDYSALIGALMTIAGIVWSVVEKRASVNKTTIPEKND